MKKELTPRVTAIAIALVVVLVGVFAWKMVAKPKAANIEWKAGKVDNHREQMLEQINRSARTAPGSYTGN